VRGWGRLAGNEKVVTLGLQFGHPAFGTMTSQINLSEYMIWYYLEILTNQMRPEDFLLGKNSRAYTPPTKIPAEKRNLSAVLRWTVHFL
jgi:hypothetical protein